MRCRYNTTPMITYTPTYKPLALPMRASSPYGGRPRGHTNTLTANGLQSAEALAMIKHRAKAANLPAGVCNHTMRAMGITAYLENGGTIEHAQAIAAHESPRTTKLYDRTNDTLTLDEIERIAI